MSNPELQGQLSRVADELGFGREAVVAMWNAIVRGNGGMAQFDHPELGGRGQWMRGGMVMVGDLFNRSLSERVGVLGDALAQVHAAHPELSASSWDDRHSAADGSASARRKGWPQGLANPSTSGLQNDMHYAWFPAERRLVIERGGVVEVYDTDDHVIHGVSQQQGGSQSLAFRSQQGEVGLASLRRVDAGGSPLGVGDGGDAVDQPDGARTAVAGGGSMAGTTPSVPRGADDPLNTLERLAELHGRGILTDDEFKAKKAELLARL
ncbi:conserved hypothetical protein [Burkholderiales bacterium 8X]|nr:conserved hypothetical protein [Burkholderiales bacterium 8X]